MIEEFSKELQNYAKPLSEEGQVVIFRLLNAGRKDENMTDQFGSQMEQTPAFWLLAGRCRVKDPGDKNNPAKILEHVTGRRPVKNPDGTTRYDNIIEKVVFKNGVVTCTPDNNHTYQFLMLHPGNKDNPFRSKTKKAVFERVDSSKVRKAELSDMDTKDNAVDLIKFADKNGLREIAKNLPREFAEKINADNPMDVLKLDLRKLADTNPRVIIKASKNMPMKIKLQMKDSERYRLIYFNEVTRTWTDWENKEICTIDVSVDRYDGLVEFLNENKENRQIYTAIRKKLGLIEEGALV